LITFAKNKSKKIKEMKKEHWITQEEVKDIIEGNDLINNAVEYLQKYYSKGDFTVYDVAKMVFDDIGDITKPVAENIWWTEECNNFMFQIIREYGKRKDCF
jgi:uncharacterized protein (UPF0305 family)